MVWDSWFKIIRKRFLFFVQLREIPLYSLPDACTYWYSNDQLIRCLTGKRGWLSGVLVKDFLNYFYYYRLIFYCCLLWQIIWPPKFAIFLKDVLRKHILKKIQGEYTLSKTWSYKTTTSLKRDLDTCFPVSLQPAFLKNTCEQRV